MSTVSLSCCFSLFSLSFEDKRGSYEEEEEEESSMMTFCMARQEELEEVAQL